jgi:hypothetical protein
MIPIKAKIDKSTGLAKLPPGHSWYVAEQRISLLRADPDTVDDYEASMIPYPQDVPKREEPLLVRSCTDTPDAYGDFYKLIQTTEKMQYTKKNWLGREKTYQKYVYVYTRVDVKTEVFGRSYPTPNTRDNLEFRTASMLDAYNRKKEIKKVTGHYPPNKL